MFSSEDDLSTNEEEVLRDFDSEAISKITFIYKFMLIHLKILSFPPFSCLHL